MNPKPPTAKQIDDACRAGLLCFYGNRQGILGAVSQGKNMMPFKNKCWIHRQSDQAWELVELATITITTEPMKGTKMPQGKGRSGAPSHLKLAAKKAAAKDEPKSEAKDEAKPETENRTTQASFKRAGKGKQAELPGVTTGERRSPEIEEAAEHWEDTKLAKAKATKEHQEADDALVAVMRKKNRILYSRSTFGTVKIPDAKIHARFTREKQEPVKKSRKK